jgi:hypothetical protein
MVIKDDSDLPFEEASVVAHIQTEANRKAWTDYLDARMRLIAEQSRLRTEIVLDGVLLELPEDDT